MSKGLGHHRRRLAAHHTFLSRRQMPSTERSPPRGSASPSVADPHAFSACGMRSPRAALCLPRAPASLSFGLVRPDGVKTGENKPNSVASLAAGGRIRLSPNRRGSTFLVVGLAPDE